MSVQLDKELYRRAYESLREWSEAEAAERARTAGQLSPRKAWQQYVALVEFCWRLSPHPDEHQRREKLAALDRYYRAVQRLEKRRQARGPAA